MASRTVEELPKDSKDVASASKQLSHSSPDDITEELQLETTNAAVKSQKSGKFRRTALTFFGVRKSICILPSFFGGRSRNQNKWSSKKGFPKSKTHDGLSKVSYDDNLRGGYTSVVDFEYHSQRDSAGDPRSSCHHECSFPAAEQKSQSLTRQKRGLRGLFNSFRHHRNHRHVGLEKTEMIAMTSPQCKNEVPVVSDNTNQFVTECLVSEPDVPDLADIICDVTIDPESIQAAAVMDSEKSVIHENPRSELGDKMCDGQTEEMNLVTVVAGEFDKSLRVNSEPCLKVKMMSEPTLKSETPAGSSDQLNMMFGDVASLKSFDSLTGCGDIIADQEDDSITESSVSGERSRNGGKRASCYLTYQGGGEEMASPEDLGEDCLPGFWGNNASEEMCCTYNQDHTDLTADLTSSHNMDLLNSNSAQQASAMDNSSMADVLTPQDEHQESVPNSDEGYYDSTTPGHDEGQEKTDRLRTDRLPRDSYSGDALYELFAPDESLISPQYEGKSKLPTPQQCEYLSEAVSVNECAFASEMNRLQISPELFKGHDFLDTPSTCSKSPELAQNVVSRQEIGTNQNCNLNSNPQASVNKNNTKPDTFNEKENASASTDKNTNPTNADCEKRQSSISFGSTSDPDFETFCEPKEQHLEENKPVALPYRNIISQSSDCKSDPDDEQAVSFSQALVDYTKHSHMLSNLHDNVDDLETSSAFTPNMEALPTIVTFDVVDMHNEGEYDEQIQMELGEDISSPYQEFEESYLQKDAFAECDYQMLDLYEENLISNTWAIASLPRHLGLTRGSQSMPNPLSLDRRSRSLDTESLELPDKYRQNRAATMSCPEKDSDRDSSPYYKKNVLVSAFESRDSSSIMALSWQTRSEMALSLPLTDGKITEKVHGHSQAQGKHKVPSSSSCSKSQRQCFHVPCDVTLQNAELYNRQSHRPLQSESFLPHSTFVYPEMMEDASDDVDEDVFCKANLQSYNQCSKSRPVGSRDGTSHAESPLNKGVFTDEMGVLETRTPRDVA